MPFRTRIKNAFRRSSTTSNSTHGSSTQTNSTSQDEHLDPNDPSVYKPHEMPRPKYRAIPDKKHKERLEAFSFANSWRRRSDNFSQYSPGGSKLSSRAGSVSEERFDSAGPRSMWKRGKTGVEKLEEASDDSDDPTNVGCRCRDHRKETSSRDVNPVARCQDTAHDHEPFTEADIMLALERSTTQQPLAATS